MAEIDAFDSDTRILKLRGRHCHSAWHMFMEKGEPGLSEADRRTYAAYQMRPDGIRFQNFENVFER